MTDFLAVTQAALNKACDPDDTPGEAQPPAYMKDRRVVVPAYNDGYMTHPSSYCWCSRRNQLFYAVNCYGVRRRYSDAQAAAVHAVTV